MSKLSRRSVIGAGGAATAAAVLGAAVPALARERGVAAATTPPPANAAEAARRIRLAYERESARAGGTWQSVVTVLDATGAHVPAVEQRADEVVEAYSVNKIAI